MPKHNCGFRTLVAFMLPAILVLAIMGLARPAFAHHLKVGDWELSGKDSIIFNHFDGAEIRFMNRDTGKFLVQNNDGSDDSNRGTHETDVPANYGRRYGFDWVLRPAGGEYWYIINLTSGLYLSWSGDNKFPAVWGNCPECNDDKVKWKFQKVLEQNSDTYFITNKASGSGRWGAAGSYWQISRSYNTLSRLRVLHIEEVTAISTSTGQDEGTKVLFAGIDLAVQLGAAAASGGTSTAMSAARAGTFVTRNALKEAAKKAIRDEIKSEIKSRLGLSKSDLLKAGARAAADGAGGGAKSTMDSATEIASTVLDVMSSEYLFNKIYGESPDDLDIQVNGSSIFPNGGRADGRKIKSQQTLQVNREVIFYHDLGFTLNLIEYDHGSGDDNLGGITWKDLWGAITPADISKYWELTDLYKTHRYEDVIITNEDEGSTYMVTFTVAALRPVGGELYERMFTKFPDRRGKDYKATKQQAQDQADLKSGQDLAFGWECNQRGVFYSSPQTTRPKTTMAIQNKTSWNLRIYWVDEQNNETDYNHGDGPLATIAPGQIYSTENYSGSRYLITDEADTCYALPEMNGPRLSYFINPGPGGSPAGSGNSAGGNAAGGNTGGNGAPAQQEPVAAAIIPGANCSLRGNFASPPANGLNAVDVWVKNIGQTDLLIYWLNDQGVEGDYASNFRPIDTIAAGQDKNFPIHAGAGYLVTDALGNCNTVMIVQPSGNRYALAADPNASPAGTDPQNGNQTSGGQTGGGIKTDINTVANYVQSGGNSCELRGQIASDPNAQPVQVPVSLTNNGTTYLYVYWLSYQGIEGDYQGEPNAIATIAPGDTQQLNSYAGHGLFGLDENSECAGIIQINPSQTSYSFGAGGTAGQAPVAGGNSGQNGGQTTNQVAGISCDKRGYFTSPTDPAQTILDVSFANTGTGNLNVYWVNETDGGEGDYNGQAGPVVSVAPGSTEYIRVYKGHRFTLTDDTNTCVGIVEAQPDALAFSFAPAGTSQNAGAGQGTAVQDPNQQRAATGGQGTGQGTAGTCSDRGALVSEVDSQPVTLNISVGNSGASNLHVFWIGYDGMEGDYNGAQQPVVTLAPGSTEVIVVYQGHRFAVLDDNYECVGIAQAAASEVNFSFAAQAGGQNTQAAQDPNAGAQNNQQVANTGTQPFVPGVAGTCDQRGSFVSESDPQQTILDISVANSGASNLHVFWIGYDGVEGDFNGAQQPVVSIAPGSTENVRVYNGHQFSILDDDYQCVGVAQATVSAVSFNFSSANGGQAAQQNTAVQQQEPNQQASGGTQNVAAGPAGSCDQRGALVSDADPQPTIVDIAIANSGGSNLNVFWIGYDGAEGNYDGEQQPVISIAPGGTEYVRVYQGHRFSILDDNYQCVGIAQATASALSFDFAGG